MSTHKRIDRICVCIVAVTVILALLFCNGKAFGIETNARTLGYENRLFDNSKVHTIDIVMNDWDSFIQTCESEQYSACNLIIDGESVKNVGIRGKGNTSLSSVKSMNSSRYSFKIEFDQYDKTKSYHGLDKLCLNNIIQDNTYMKDYLAYTLMYDFGVDAPLCSFAYITVNGEDWGLYLAVEAVEDSFLERNYGNDYGDLYKPDSMNFGGGGPGNGKNFNMTDFIKENTVEEDDEEDSDSEQENGNTGSAPDMQQGNFDFSNIPNMGNGNFDPSNIPNMGDGNFDPSNMPNMGEGGFDPSNIPAFGGNTDNESASGESTDKNSRSKGGFGGFGGGFGMGSDDVKLKYIDDNAESYSNIFGNAKTTLTKADKNRLINSLKTLSDQSDITEAVDVDEVLRYFVVHIFLCNGDSYTGSMIHNYYLYEKDGQLSMIPWDYNLAYGSFQGGSANSSVNSAIDTPVSGDMNDRPMVSWIFNIEEYTEKYHELFIEFINSVDLTKMIDETAALIDEYVEKDPTKFCTYEEFKTGVEAIKTFCELRKQSVEGQLNGTIPSTSSGQSADSSSLIDASGLNTSDMGSMGGGFGGGNKGGFNAFNKGENREKPEKNDESGLSEVKDETDSGEGSGVEMSTANKGKVSILSSQVAPSGNGGSRGDFGGRGGNMPEGFDPSQAGVGNMPEGFDPSQAGVGNMPKDNASSDGDIADSSNGATERPSTDRSSSNRNSFNGTSFSGFSGSGQDDDLTEIILLGSSALVLVVGIIFASIFKRRK